ncbi:MAG: cation:dicarboxylase symporter family transporter [Atopobiaceae bacterium]|nr:cation:dicarboxylase symporter family transporter [Atopobiaceae bacterium]
MGDKAHGFRLDDAGIDEASDLLASHLEGTGLPRRDVMALRLALETALIRLRSRLGDAPVEFYVTRWLGRPRLLVRVRGERFDPLGDFGDSGWESQLLETLDLRPSYAYLAGQNIVSITTPRKPLGSLVRILIALVLGDATAGIRDALRELNSLAHFLMEQLCRLLPAFVFVMVVIQAWSGTFGVLLAAWWPVLEAAIVMVAFFALQLLVVCRACRASVRRVLLECFPAIMTAFSTASSSSSFGSMVAACRERFGVDEEQVSFGVPLGLVLCKCAIAIDFIVLVVFAASLYGIVADTSWYIRLCLTCLFYAVAAPPVPGGTIACYGLLLATMGVPMEALAVLVAIDMVLDYPTTAIDVGSIMLSVLSAANSIGSVDRDRLMGQAGS